MPVKPAAPALDFNHAMIYSANVPAALAFYHDLLGLELLEDYRHQGRTVYARLKAPGSNSTIALHALEPGRALATGGIRLYFEIRNLDTFCKRLVAKGAVFSKLPTVMPWGWKHAYLDDPDGHEVSLYWAGAKRLKKVNPRA